jgi:hypothetical protein
MPGTILARAYWRVRKLERNDWNVFDVFPVRARANIT